MTDLTEALNEDQSLMLEVVFNGYGRSQQWPNWQYVRRAFRRSSASDPKMVLDSFPVVGSRYPTGPSYSTIHFSPLHHGDDAPLRITLAAGLHLAQFRRTADHIVKIISFFADGVSNADPDDDGDFVIASEQMKHDPGFNMLSRTPRLLDHTIQEPVGFFKSSHYYGTNSDNWTVTLNEEGLLPFAGVTSLEDYVARTVSFVKDQAHYFTSPVVAGPTTPKEVDETGAYVNIELIKQLEGLSSPNWHLGKLVNLLKELNSNVAAGNPYSSLTLCRAIINHVPAVFGHQKFEQVVSQMAGTTDKKHLQNLASNRALADDVAHRPISRRPDLIEQQDIPHRIGINTLVHLVIERLRAQE